MESTVDRLKAATKAAFDAAAADCPELCLHQNGLALFLGNHYADTQARILMLGLNPGLLREESGGAFFASYSHNYDLADSNILLGDPSDENGRRVRYWRNARRCFGATANLRATMALATFAFCCPFRTASWSDLTARQRSLLEAHSRPVLRLILNDCQPRLVIVAGGQPAIFCSEAELSTRTKQSQIRASRVGPRSYVRSPVGRTGGNSITALLVFQCS